MGLFARGYLTLTPIEVRGYDTLQAVLSRLGPEYSDTEAPTRGWGRVALTQPDDGDLVKRERPGSPAIVRSERHALDVGHATVLHDVERPEIRRRFQPAIRAGLELNQRYELQPIDVALAEVTSRNERYLAGVVVTHETSDLRYVEDRLQAAAGDGAKIRVGSRFHRTTSRPEFFAWLVHVHLRRGGEVTKKIRVEEVRTIQYESPFGHLGRLLEGVDEHRIDLLGAVASDYNLGPAKAVIYDADTKLRADLYLLTDGTYTIHRTRTFYDDEVSPPDFGLRAALDIQLHTFPRLIRAYNGAASTYWAPAERSKFRTWAGTEAISILKSALGV